MRGVDEQQEAARQAQVPEYDGQYAAPFHLALEPLHDEARCEHGLSEQADTEPDAVVCHVGHCALASSSLISSTESRVVLRPSHITPSMSTSPAQSRSWMP